MKTFILTVSRVFPATHKRKGESTLFQYKIQDAKTQTPGEWWKLHSIRNNYPLWAKRIKQVQEGIAVLKVVYWKFPGGRFVKGNSQVEICHLDKDSGIEVQALIFPDKSLFNATVCGPEFPMPTWYKGVGLFELSKNDGLSLEDFKEWFRKYDLSKPMAIIHLTHFRY